MRLGIYETYLGHTSDQVHNQALEGTEDSDMLPSSLPHSKSNLVDLALQYPDIDIGVTDVLRQSTTGTLDGDNSRLDGDVNAVRDVELFGLENVPHL